jgi:hypothetical protein
MRGTTFIAFPFSYVLSIVIVPFGYNLEIQITYDQITFNVMLQNHSINATAIGRG